MSIPWRQGAESTPKQQFFLLNHVSQFRRQLGNRKGQRYYEVIAVNANRGSSNDCVTHPHVQANRLCEDSLTSEHSMRLITSEAARKWINESAQTGQRQVSAVRRENSTQEVLDIVAASERRKYL